MVPCPSLLVGLKINRTRYQAGWVLGLVPELEPTPEPGPQPELELAGPGESQEIELLDDALEGELEEIPLLDEDLAALAASGVFETHNATTDPNALSMPDSDGDPEEAVPLANDAVLVNDRENLFDTSPVDLTSPDEEPETE